MTGVRRPLILNVDDDEAGRYVVTRQLRQASYDVIEAASGKETLEKVAALHPDLVLLDVQLPDMNGFEVCRHLRQNPQTARVSILHLSATYDDADSRAHGLEGGADGYLTEPIEPRVMMATINALLRLKMAEQAVREAAAQWQATFDAISDGVAVLDGSGRVLRSNQALEVILGKQDSEIKGAFWNDLLPSPAEKTAPFQRMLASRRRETEEQRLGNKILAASIDPIFDEAGTPAGGVCIVGDVTAQRRFEREIQHTQKLDSIGVLAGGVAHDFNNLLTGILGNASLMADSLPAGDPNIPFVEEIVHSSESAAHLTQQLLAYAGKGIIFVRPLDLSKVIFETRPLIQSFVPKHIVLKLELAERVPEILGDPGQIQQIVMNLAINAAEAIGQQPGVITLRTAIRDVVDDHDVAPGEYVALEVCDTGCGMDAATKAKIFDPFFTTKFTGRGLGLSAVQGIVRAHKGSLRVISAPGEGASFRVLFPVVAATGTPLAPARATSKGKDTILVVDDESAVRQMAGRALERHGFAVVLAESGPEAIRILARDPARIDLVLLDVAMPVLSGEDTFERMLKIRPDLPVLLSSGFNEAIALPRFEGKKIAGFVQKPYTASTLAQRIAAELEKIKTMGI